jgi:YfiR/HmsC-like
MLAPKAKSEAGACRDEKQSFIASSGATPGLRDLTKETRWFFLLIAMMATALPPLEALAQSRSAGEYELKAAFLFNFAKFVEWPPGSFSGIDAPIRLCLLGADPFEGSLEQVVQDKLAGGRRLQVEHPLNASKARGCHILFVSSLEGKPDRALLHGGYGPGVLTVGETSDFTRAGGVIDFVQQQNRVAFEINLEAADRAGVKISSKLLSLARIVRDNPAAPTE